MLRCRRIVLLFTFLIFFVTVVMAQKTPPSNTGTSGAGNTGTPSVTTTPAPRPSIPSIQQQPREQPRVTYLTGQVAYDDGTVPTESVSIERVCNGRARREGYTDSTGHFSLQLGRDLGFQDASIGSDIGFGPGTRASSAGPGIPNEGISERELIGCELRAVAPGAWSDVVILAGRHAMDDPNVGTIVLHRMGKVEGTRVSVTSMQAPKDAKKAFERARKAMAKQKWADAQHDLEKAVAVYPNYADSWLALGIALAAQQQPVDARKAFERAQTIDPKFMLPYFHLALLSVMEQDWTRVAELTDKALSLDAYEYPAAYYYNSMAYFYLKNLDKAEKSARTARRLDSQYQIPKIDLVLTSVLLQRQDYTAAAQQLREFLKHAPTGPDADRARVALADTEQRIASSPSQPKQ